MAGSALRDTSTAYSPPPTHRQNARDASSRQTPTLHMTPPAYHCVPRTLQRKGVGGVKQTGYWVKLHDGDRSARGQIHLLRTGTLMSATCHRICTHLGNPGIEEKCPPATTGRNNLTKTEVDNMPLRNTHKQHANKACSSLDTIALRVQHTYGTRLPLHFHSFSSGSPLFSPPPPLPLLLSPSFD